MYSIGEMSKLFNVSVQTIRLYCKKGLVIPAHVNEATGYRYFDDQNLRQIWKIIVLKSAGFALEEILTLEEHALSELHDQYLEKYEKLSYEVQQKQMALAFLEKRMDAIKIMADYDDSIWYEDIGDRYGKQVDAKFVDLYHHFEKLVSIEDHLGVNQEVAHQPSRYTQYKDGVWHVVSLMAIHTRETISDLSKIQGGKFICSYNIKGHSRQALYDRLMAQASADGYEIRGDGLELILLEGSDHIQALYKFQIAVQ